MGNQQSKHFSSEVTFKPPFDEFRQSIEAVFNPSNFINLAFLACFRKQRQHVCDDDYYLTLTWKRILKKSAEEAFAFYKELYSLIENLEHRKKIPKENPFFREVIAKCRENPDFSKSTSSRRSRRFPYSWKKDDLDIFFAQLQVLILKKLSDLCIFEKDINMRMTQNVEYPLDMDEFHDIFEPYLRAYINRHVWDDRRTGDGSFLEHPEVFRVFVSTLEDTINRISFHLVANSTLECHPWITNSMDDIEWIGIFTSCCYTIERPGGYFRESILELKEKYPNQRLKIQLL